MKVRFRCALPSSLRGWLGILERETVVCFGFGWAKKEDALPFIRHDRGCALIRELPLRDALSPERGAREEQKG